MTGSGISVSQVMLLCGLLLVNTIAGAAFIDFESIPGVGVPQDGMSISNQFEASHGVVFSLEGGGNPVIAKAGNPRTAFIGPGGASDTPAASQETGTYFLTDDGNLSTPAAPLLIAYNSAVNATSGVIIDIDFAEEWTIEALNIGNVLETLVLNAASLNAGDGLATQWQFSRNNSDIDAIRIRFTGSLGGGATFVGLAFDKFSTDSVAAVPIPAAVWLFGSGLLGLFGVARRKQGRL